MIKLLTKQKIIEIVRACCGCTICKLLSINDSEHVLKKAYYEVMNENNIEIIPFSKETNKPKWF